MYLLDSNVFIQAANTYYGLALVPSFWRWIGGQALLGNVQTIQMVREELEAPPELVHWASSPEAEALFIDDSSPEIQARFQEVVDHVSRGPYGDAHKWAFLSGADPWLVAAASARQLVVVTEEVRLDPRAGSPKVKLPNVCEDFGVAHTNTFGMLRESNAAL